MSEALETLTGYVNRQVVLNTYEGDELLSRDGFFFDEIRINPDCILFIRENQVVKKLNLEPSYHFDKLTRFTRYYAIDHQNGVRTELYFP